MDSAVLSSSELKQRALMYLRKTLGNDSAEFRDGQWEAIESIVRRKKKLLVVQRTGWGKSIVYFLATKLLRETGAGPTLLVSPLLSLMRNQINAANRLITAESIDSTNTDDWDVIKARILAGELDVLLVSPERLANESFVNEVLSRIISKVGLFVVDEAHCISDWGHDFRPDYMRIARIVRALPPNTPALATTATANNRVVADIVNQLGSELEVIRGPLVRQSLRLQNINMPNQAARMAWLAENLPKIQGSGIIYTLTVRDAERLAEWLRIKGIDAHAYHSGGDSISSEKKKLLEQKLLDNEVKVLVATVALGMGFDKPDLEFVIHFQRPASVVHYYQQVGRAGRAVERAYGILFSGSEDDDIAEYFIETAFPPAVHVSKVITAIENAPDGLTKHQLLQKINLSDGQLEKVLTILSVQSPSPIVKQDRKYKRAATSFALDSQRIEQLKATKRAEQKRMQEYMQTADCLMEFLSKELDDPCASKCGMCACCSEKPLLPTSYNTPLAVEASAFLRRSDIVIKPRAMMPSELSMKSIPKEHRSEYGRALCMWGDVGWGDLVRQGKQVDGCFAHDLVKAASDMIHNRWKPQPFPAWVACVPSLTHENLIPSYAKRLADALGVPFIPCVTKVRHTQPQKLMYNSNQQFNNIKDAFTIDVKLVMPGAVLLVDDIVDSGWTLTVIAALLRANGSGEVFPLALAKT